MKTHKCSAAGCAIQVKLAMLMCPEHWRLVPRPLRSEVWKYYRRGQEKTGMATPSYYAAARQAIAAVAMAEAKETTKQGILL